MHVGGGLPLVCIGNDPIWSCEIATDRRVGEATNLCIVIARQLGSQPQEKKMMSLQLGPVL